MSDSTTTYPYGTIVYITDEIGGVEYQASGVLIAPDEVLTASHVVYSTGVGTATDIEVSPGYEDGATPYGTVAGVSFHYNEIDDSDDSITNEDSQDDYAVIHLASPITSVGTMELGDNYGGGTVTVSGYPASANGTQVDSQEKLTVDPDYTLFDGRALGEGSSGGPVWITAANGQAEVVGLVSSGSGREGYFVQITAADYNQIESWVAADDGTTNPGSGGGATPATPAGETPETVTGAGGATITLYLPTVTAPLGGTLLGQLSADIAAGSVVAENAVPGSAPPAVPSGKVGELVVGQSEAVTPSAAYQAIIDTASGASTVVLAADINDSVVASGGPLTLMAGATSGTLVGGSAGALFTEAANGGAWDIAFGGGSNTVVAGGGSDTISAGSGNNLIFLGSGVSSVASTGTDTIVGGSGAATVSAGANQALVFAGGAALTFDAGSGVSTVIAGAGGATVQGGSAGTLFFADGASSYHGGGAADTVLGGSGPLTANGGGGSVLIFGGANGHNRLTSGGGQATLVGGGGGDVLTATGTANVVLVASSGAETLNGTGGSGANIFFGGVGNDLIEGGGGNDLILAGKGNDTLSGGRGVNVFEFVDGYGGGTDTITDFSASRDYVELAGFATGLSATVLTAAIVKSETVSSSGTTIALPDGTQILFSGVSGLSGTTFL
jgi:Ca2+-binding RTX toxin-like protein/V8-like Glu-specific endopeptidase